MDIKNFLLFQMMGMPQQQALIFSMLAGGSGGNSDMLLMLMLMGGLNGTSTGDGVTNTALTTGGTNAMLPLMLLAGKKKRSFRSYRSRRPKTIVINRRSYGRRY